MEIKLVGRRTWEKLAVGVLLEVLKALVAFFVSLCAFFFW
jgi:hypothetical protein